MSGRGSLASGKKRRNVQGGTFCTGEIVSTRIYSLGPEDYESQDFSRLKLGRIRDRLIPQSLAVSSGDDDRKEQPGAVHRDGGRHCSSHIGAAVEASVALSCRSQTGPTARAADRSVRATHARIKCPEQEDLSLNVTTTVSWVVNRIAGCVRADRGWRCLFLFGAYDLQQPTAHSLGVHASFGG